MRLKRVIRLAGAGLIVMIAMAKASGQTCDGVPDHFFFSQNTGQSYSIVLDSAVVGCGLRPCDEVGVFDGSLCVGAAVYAGTWPLAVSAWANDTQTPSMDGYSCGDTMIFKVWLKATNLESVASVHLGTGETGDGTFCNGPYSKLWLEAPLSNCDDVTDMRPGIIPTGYSLSQNYPNPFNSGTEIRFALPRAGWVALVIYDVLGQEVSQLVLQELEPGVKSVPWDGRDSRGDPLPSGVYLCRLRAGTFTSVRKMILLK